ncbi:hypothetical protein ABBQ32_013041 [Trebouxia sp. C0010 RCD-2024]
MTAPAAAGALAHVCMHATGLDLSHDQPSGRMKYDEGTGIILFIAGQQVHAYSTSPSATTQQPLWVASPGEGDSIASLNVSLDGAILAVQRGTALIQFIHLQSSKLFVQGPKSRARLLSFFWCPSTACDFVMATGQGLELYQRLPQGQGLRYKGSRKHPTTWCTYSHESRIALLATGQGGLWLQAYQVTNDAVLKLPPFQLGPSASQQASPKSGPSQRVSSQDIRILTIYGRIYCAHIDHPHKRLVLYRFFKDAVVLQHTYEIYSRRIELSVHDNVLLVHHLDSSTVLLLDVRARTNGPIVGPLPLAIALENQDDQSVPASIHASMREDHLEREGRVEVGSSSSAAASTSGSISTASSRPDHLDSRHWTFQLPNLILDTQACKVWRCEVDIAAVGRTCTNWPLLLAFLQRRQPLLHPSCDIKALLLAIVKGVLLEQLNMCTVKQVFDACALGYAEACAAPPSPHQGFIPSSPETRGRALRLAAPALAPQEVELKVLRWLHEEEATGVQYLEAAIAQYLASCSWQGIAVPAGLHLLSIDVALLRGHKHQVVCSLHQQGGGWDSGALAAHLERLARKAELPEAWQLALDMYARLGMHDKRCQMLLAKGKVVQALRLAQEHQVQTIAPDSFLTKGAETGDVQVFSAVYRVCQQAAQPRIEPYITCKQRFEKVLQSAAAKA